METILKKNLEGYLFYFLQGKHFQWDKKNAEPLKTKYLVLNMLWPCLPVYMYYRNVYKEFHLKIKETWVLLFEQKFDLLNALH